MSIVFVLTSHSFQAYRFLLRLSQKINTMNKYKIIIFFFIKLGVVLILRALFFLYTTSNPISFLKKKSVRGESICEVFRIKLKIEFNILRSE